jgi:hypothetical protein
LTFHIDILPEEPQQWDLSIIPAPFTNTPHFFQRLIGKQPPTLHQCSTLAAAIENESLLSCSDGAYCPVTYRGSQSWLFGSVTDHSIARGAGPTDGHPTSMSSYRTELGGILAALYIIHRICEYYAISSGKVILYCDNKGAIGNIFKPAISGISPYLSSNYDLLRLIKHLVATIPITIIGEWVKVTTPERIGKFSTILIL